MEKKLDGNYTRMLDEPDMQDTAGEIWMSS